MNSIIETENLTCRFGKKEVIRGLTMKVPEGSIFAFLGPNGAGKTTTIKMLMNILSPSAGWATVLGADSRRLSPTELARIGYVSENQQLPEWMTIEQLVNFCRPMYPGWDAEFAGRLSQQFNLPLREKIANLSRGMKIKTALLVSLAYRPTLLILDEPFSGLDALVRDEFIRGVLELTAQENWTVFISSHDLDEVERLADWVGMIHEGQLKRCESMASLQERFRQIQVAIAENQTVPASCPANWLNLEKTGRSLRFVDTAYFAATTEKAVRQVLPQAGVVTATPMSLKEIFLVLTRHYQFNLS
ncbi:MAG: ABC transporter ATP-binding protein [Verrucomicrobiae bacterium]|nr:ABC transporter ATP-binding protein [Verrucomicrobiae bacterium]